MSVQSLMFEQERGEDKREQWPNDVVQFLSSFDDVPIDRKTIPQWRLDLVNRTRTSVFPWRGQFSPELIELLLTTFADSEATLLDPFVGSGTTLFEAARLGHASIGAEINPAAVIMASAARFVSLDTDLRRDYLTRFRRLVECTWPIEALHPIESEWLPGGKTSASQLRSLLTEADDDFYVSNLVSNLTVRLSDRLKSGQPISAVEVWKQAHALERIILDLPFSAAECVVLHADARCLPLPSQSVDLIITSPPYINVFNYHQNYRAASELMGWNMLTVARSEFGSNRKNRGNRFLTVIQYAIDMLSNLREMRRLLRLGGQLIIIVGRESNVRGVRFENARIVAALATGGAGFCLEKRQERKFKSKFGQTIYEDILHLTPTDREIQATENWGRQVGEAVLAESLAKAESDVAAFIRAALANSFAVQASPVFASTSGMVA